MPYFSYITMLHLYETLGFWRRSADVKRIHFAEEINEYKHLLIMESLGGDQLWYVRFLAQHSAILYFVVLCILWALSPTLSYKFSEMLETHAVHTYGQLLEENEILLKSLPPSITAVEYYTFGYFDPFYAEFQTSSVSSSSKDDNGSKKHDIRRPGSNMKSLYDVFSAIQADEIDHVLTMKSCLDKNAIVQSISIERKVIVGTALTVAASTVLAATTGGAGSSIVGGIDPTSITSSFDFINTTLIEETFGSIGTLFDSTALADIVAIWSGVIITKLASVSSRKKDEDFFFNIFPRIGLLLLFFGYIL
jgi:ubiquinol oxidase